jgi:hypothetical protein
MPIKQTSLVQWLGDSNNIAMRNDKTSNAAKGNSYLEAIDLDLSDKENENEYSYFEETNEVHTPRLPEYKHAGTDGVWRGSGGTPFQEEAEGHTTPSCQNLSSNTTVPTPMYGGVPLEAGRGLTHNDVKQIRHVYNLRAQDEHLQAGMADAQAAKHKKHKYSVKSNKYLKSR